MLLSLIRALIIYVIITAIMRLMGKRQIGELQPTELIIMMLLSELVAIPLEDNEIPLMNSLAAVAVLACVEVISSVIGMKSKRFRSVVQGHAVILIREGVIDQKEMKTLRLTVDDLLLALRQKDVFDIETVQYAILETSGQLSVLLKAEERPAAVKDTGAQVQADSFPALLIADGKLNSSALRDAEMTRKELDRLLKSEKAQISDVFLLTADRRRNTRLVRKEGEE
ncbi:MAG: DUF421 domain-containing protein [Oscillospiraceae bacterium]|jgi:uncharacterized membrane protein YcaP (DUF421 family)|nr:DUF421 domain-containing protein [Oscillospiraceae bacterium]